MNDYLIAVILGVLEGLTEFLPVSSTGHMIIAMPMLGVSAADSPWKTLLWVSQMGAILAVVVYFFRPLWRETFTPPDRRFERHIVVKLVAAMIPTIALGLAFDDLLDPLEQSPPAVGMALLVGAAAMLYVDRRFRREAPMQLVDVTLAQAFWIGVVQCLSMWPGVSRAGASILGGMALGLTPRVATEFSFYLAIPTLLAAGAKTLWDERSNLAADQAAVVLTGTATAFVVALAVIAWFLDYVKRSRFTAFVVYRVLLGAAVLGWWAARTHS